MIPHPEGGSGYLSGEAGAVDVRQGWTKKGQPQEPGLAPSGSVARVRQSAPGEVFAEHPPRCASPGSHWQSVRGEDNSVDAQTQRLRAALPTAGQQFRRLALQGVADRVERVEVHARRRVLDIEQAVRGGRGDRATARFRKRVGGFERRPLGVHQLAKSEAHIKHNTNVTTEAARRNGVFTLAGLRFRTYISIPE